MTQLLINAVIGKVETRTLRRAIVSAPTTASEQHLTQHGSEAVAQEFSKQSVLVSQDFNRNLHAGSYVWELLDERNLNNAFWQMPLRIRKIGSFEDRKNPKPGPTFHQTRSDEDVLVVVEINLVLPRYSLCLVHGEVWHLSVDFYVYCALMKRQSTQVQYILIKLGSAFAEVSKARPGYLSLEHSRAHSLLQPFESSGAAFR